MGLHGEMKAYLKEDFPECFVDDLPREHVDVQICDAMWILYKFCPDDASVFDDLAAHMWRSIEPFYRNGGRTFIACFDDCANVPTAKCEEQRKRRTDHVEPVVVVDRLPRPWRSGLADAKVRATLMRDVCDVLHENFKSLNASSTTLITHVDASPVRAHVDRKKKYTIETMPETRTGEADVAVAHWIRKYPHRPVATRVLDSDHIPIAVLTAHASERSQPLYVWIRSAKGDARDGALCDEPRDILCVPSLLREIERARCSAPDFCFFIVCQQTDFVKKVIHALSAKKTMRRIVNSYHRGDVLRPFLRCTLREQSFDAKRALRFLTTLATASKRAKVIPEIETEIQRAWWNVQYWALPVPPPCENFGWTENGDRIV